MRVLILGGTGFIGPPAVRRLVELGHEVTLFHRGETASGSLPPAVRHLYGDRQALAGFRTVFEGLQPDVVLHMAPFTEADGRMLVEIFRGLTRRLVVISSVDVYRAYDRFRGKDPGPPDACPLTEESPLRGRLHPYREPETDPTDFAYGYEKILMERAARREPDALPATVLRLPMVYGPGDYQHRLFPYLKRMDDGRPAILLPEDMAAWRGPRGYVEDIGEAIALCVTRDEAAGCVYHVADADNLTEAEWVRRIGAAAGWTGEPVTHPNEQLPETLRHHYDPRQEWSLDSTRIRRELGYREPTPPDEAMRRAVEWERAHPPSELNSARFDYAAEEAARLQRDNMPGSR